MRLPSLLEILLYFGGLSLIAVGGANVVIPDMHRHVVEVEHWMNGAEFVALAALAQAAPGPNVLIVSLIGWKLAGFGGAVVATAGMCVPSGLLAYFFSGVWQHFERAPWRAIVAAGLGGVTVGLILASGYVLTRAADHSWIAYAITAATALLMSTTRLHPLWLLAVAAALGAFGMV